MFGLSFDSDRLKMASLLSLPLFEPPRNHLVRPSTAGSGFTCNLELYVAPQGEEVSHCMKPCVGNRILVAWEMFLFDDQLKKNECSSKDT
jgi:hypothetical protein